MPLIKLNNRSIKDVTSLPFGVGNLIHISSQTASNSASISFTTGIDSTYKEYQFYFIDIAARTQRAILGVNFSTDGGSNYNVTKTTTAFFAYHSETNDADAAVSYDTGFDLAQSTADQRLTQYITNASDSSACGNMSLFNPSSTTYVKHFISCCNNMVITSDFTEYFTMNQFVAGYGNTTSAINAVRFQMSSGNMDGTIAMFGVV
jgi:hypothetical protein